MNRSAYFLLILGMICCLSIAQGQRWPVPEMNMYGNGRPIADGDMTPSPNDHTDFGEIGVGFNLTRTYTIKNVGTGKLYLTGSPLVEIIGTHASDFAVTLQPAGIVLPGAQTNLQVRFTPAQNGLRSAVVKILHSDSNENPYNFAIHGTGYGQEINVQGNSLTIVDGDTTPSTSDHTDFGNVILGNESVHIFTIQNVGGASLNLTGNPIVNLSGSGDFTILSQAETPVAPGSSTIFQIKFVPSSTGIKTASVTIANDDLDENPYDFVIQGTGQTNEPEINVKGNGVDIVDGDTTPSTADHTDFGTASTYVIHTFSVQNLGFANLNLTNTPTIQIVGSNDFAVFTQAETTVAPSRYTSFQIRFTPSSSGVKTATISIANDDNDESPYNFNIQGTGEVKEPEINLQGNGIDILNGDTTPSTSDHTDFGDVTVGSNLTRSFTIQNLGNGNLGLTGSPVVQLSGSSDFSVVLQATTPVLPGISKVFQIRFMPDSTGTKMATVTIANDDNDENPYRFSICGTGLAPEMNIKGNNVDIVDGDTTPSLTDHTDFGSASLQNREAIRKQNQSVKRSDSRERDGWDPQDNTGSGATELFPSSTEQAHGQHSLGSSDYYDWFKIYMYAGKEYELKFTNNFSRNNLTLYL